MATHSTNGTGPYTHTHEPTYLQRYAHVVGWGRALPENVLTNEDLEAIVETNDEWIRSRTGIAQRYVANERETTASLGLKAAQNALEVADILPIEVDLVIVATSTPENIFPSTASLIQNWLGASRAGAFDLSAACSGFVYGVDMASQAIKSGSIKTAVVVGAETMSRILDWQDRSTCILFGDGAGAVVLQASEQPGGVLSSVLRSDGSGYDLLGVPTVGSCDIAYMKDDHKIHKLHMNGREVFKFATRIVGDSILQALDNAGLTMDDVKVVVPHQANDRILQSAARNLKVAPETFFSTVAKYGNTSAASIPIALCEALEQGKIEDKDNIVFVGFGGGLTWAAMVVEWGHPVEDRASNINQQRRQLAYFMARWRARLRRYRRRFSDRIARVRPQEGRMSRLRTRLDELSPD
ncbi:MAG: beta-ketoacyl-ACP synthase III [Chloroflexota bacterium]